MCKKIIDLKHHLASGCCMWSGIEDVYATGCCARKAYEIIKTQGRQENGI